jgi:hypothetical protein
MPDAGEGGPRGRKHRPGLRPTGVMCRRRVTAVLLFLRKVCRP